MPDSNDQKFTILVKKADGKSVRMTLEEFKKYQSGIASSQPNIQPVNVVLDNKKNAEPAKLEIKNLEIENKKPVVEKIPVGELVEVKTEALSTTAPVSDLFINEAIASQKLNNAPEEPKKWTAEDHQSPLEENLEIKKNDFQPLPAKKEDEVSSILKKIKFPIKDELLERFKSLIVSRLKNIRTNEQILEYALKPEDKGGLGLSNDQAQELLKLFSANNYHKEITGTKNLAGDDSLISAKQTPVYSAKNDQAVGPKSQELGGKEKIDQLIKQSSGGSYQLPGASMPNKQVVQDIQAPVYPKKTIGPVEEIAMMSLVDFRRLSTNTKQAGEILKEKFLVLKKESFIYYLQAKGAWLSSPLYLEYQSVINRALLSQTKISDILASNGRDQLRVDEFGVLVQLNENLN